MEALRDVGDVCVDTVAFLVALKLDAKLHMQILYRAEFCRCQGEVKHGVLLPLLFQFLYGKPLEQVFAAGEVGVKRTREQRFAETTGTGEKHILTRMSDFIYVLCLVNIQVSAFTNLFECLNANWIVYHSCAIFPQT